ncbi:MAG: S24/S26 family peptidase [bacterium]
MLYSLQIKQKEKQTQTNIFGTKCLLTLGVEIIGKKLDAKTHSPFKSVDELIEFKNSMRKPPKGNVPILLRKEADKIEVSGRLLKSDSLSHDPNIGALSLICASLRKLGWNKKLVVTEHGLSQKHIKGNNKFIQIASKLNIEFHGLQGVFPGMKDFYWHYEKEGEKLGTIFIHLVVENFTHGSSLFENHAGCEKGYFITKTGNPIPLEKYQDREKYKNGDKNQIVHIPDLILIDFDKSEIINIEGKKYKFRANGINELNNFEAIEDLYIRPNYPKFQIIRTVVLYGSTEERVVEIEVGFLLNENGKLILGIKAPDLFKVAIRNLLDYWNITAEKSDLFFSDVIPEGSYEDGLVPVYDLHAYATSFKEQSTPESLGWKPYSGRRKLQDGMFMARVVGRSMETTIMDGSWCLFRPDQGGTRKNKVVLVESRHINDPETSKSYTIKRYFSEKAAGEDENSFRHTKIILKPDNKDFDDIVLPEGTEEGEFHVVAEWVENIDDHQKGV